MLLAEYLHLTRLLDLTPIIYSHRRGRALVQEAFRCSIAGTFYLLTGANLGGYSS